jgi:acyl-CoA thioesterase FadM
MNLLLRFLLILAGMRRRPRLRALDESVLGFRVLPTDLDLNLHMNNGRYLSLMDLGRLDLIGRMGVMRRIVRHGWRPVVGSLTIRYRRSLEPFQRYQLHSRLLAWDEKWLYVEQRFVHRGELMALALVKGLFLAPGGRLSPQAVVDVVEPGLPSPPLPEAVLEWQRSEELLRGADAVG